MTKGLGVPKESGRESPADAEMARLLRKELAAALAPSSPCLDAEAIAAWSDGSLDPVEAASVETHLSTCGHCQAVLAAFTRTAAVRPPARRSGPSATVVWFASAVAAVAAIFLWITWPQLRGPARIQTLTQVEPRANARDQQKDKPSAQDRAEPSRQAAAAAQPLQQGTSVIAPGSEAASNAGARAKAEVATDSKAARAGVPSVLQGTTGVDRRNDMLDAIAAVTTLEITSAAPASVGAQALSAASGERAQSSLFRTKWRVLVNGNVERSADGGANWTRVLTEPAGTITAGSAPSDSVCWLAGQNGLVLRSADGRPFEPVSPAGHMDVSTIVATDGTQATVTTSDGRTLRTSDAGATWH